MCALVYRMQIGIKKKHPFIYSIQIWKNSAVELKSTGQYTDFKRIIYI